MYRIILICALSACTVASAQLDAENVCITYSDVKIAAVAPETTTLDHTWTYAKLAAIQALAAQVQDLTFVSIDAHATSGITSLEFIDAAHVTVASGDPTSTLPTLDVYDCIDDCVPDGDSLSVPSMLQQSAIAYVESGSIVVDMQLTGQIPTIDWTMDADFCFSGVVGFSESL
jgi:hypothetical protein